MSGEARERITAEEMAAFVDGSQAPSRALSTCGVCGEGVLEAYRTKSFAGGALHETPVRPRGDMILLEPVTSPVFHVEQSVDGALQACSLRGMVLGHTCHTAPQARVDLLEKMALWVRNSYLFSGQQDPRDERSPEEAAAKDRATAEAFLRGLGFGTVDVAPTPPAED